MKGIVFGDGTRMTRMNADNNKIYIHIHPGILRLQPFVLGGNRAPECSQSDTLRANNNPIDEPASIRGKPSSWRVRANKLTSGQ
jgi:hypothetical protein